MFHGLKEASGGAPDVSGAPSGMASFNPSPAATSKFGFKLQSQPVTDGSGVIPFQDISVLKNFKATDRAELAINLPVKFP